MMKDEFVKLAQLDDAALSSEGYAKVEKVYAFHPYFSKLSKKAIAIAYNMGGIELMEVLLPAAEKAEAIYEDTMKAQAKMDRTRGELEEYDAETARIMEERKRGRVPVARAFSDAELESEVKLSDYVRFNNIEEEKFRRWSSNFTRGKFEEQLAKQQAQSA